ncbi:hypothetical protein NXS19_004544 [Fusarium pseudograminearum]|nr:hypothetical protein NXS19_004544 [Fusarium pseudograminearum]
MTTYLPAGTQGDPNTVLVEIPPDYNVTATQTVSTISRARTTYNPGATQGDPGTVLVQLPAEYNVTITTTIPTLTRASTTFAPAGTQGDPGTVIVELPPTPTSRYQQQLYLLLQHLLPVSQAREHKVTLALSMLIYLQHTISQELQP